MVSNSSDGRNVISGKVIFDTEYAIISANENFYRFTSPIIRNITDVIHQIDLDDFLAVVSDLGGYSTGTMILRMKRFDNSFRWVVANIKYANVEDLAEGKKIYFELEFSDIINLYNHYNALTNVFEAKTVSVLYKDLQEYEALIEYAKTYQQNHPNDQLSFGIFEIDRQDFIVHSQGEEGLEELRNKLAQKIYDSIGDVKLIARTSNGNICFCAINIGIEVYLRSFIEAIRNQIAWEYISQRSKMSISFSIGIAEYPRNSRNLDIVIKKLEKAYALAVSKGRGRYIIYKEEIHGEL